MEGARGAAPARNQKVVVVKQGCVHSSTYIARVSTQLSKTRPMEDQKKKSGERDGGENARRGSGEVGVVVAVEPPPGKPSRKPRHEVARQKEIESREDRGMGPHVGKVYVVGARLFGKALLAQHTDRRLTQCMWLAERMRIWGNHAPLDDFERTSATRSRQGDADLSRCRQAAQSVH